MTNKASHPTNSELAAYGLGQLDPEAAAAVEEHINRCEPCCETIAGYSTQDTFVGLLQEARELPTQSSGAKGQRTTDSDVPEVPAPLVDHPRYEVFGLIGRGGMGHVFRARHRMMNRTVALKVIKQEFVRKPEAVDRFRREVTAAVQHSHPNIVTAFDAEQAEDVHYLVMECVDGIDLAELVKDRGALPVAEACDYVRQAAVGLQHAHERGMVHRDIKPHNLMVTDEDTVKILDFGLASLAPVALANVETTELSGDLTAAGAIMGTPDFISPEQAKDARSADIRSDIYSLGMTLYFLLSGRVPFGEGTAADKLKLHGETHPVKLNEIRSDVPEGVQKIFDRMTAKDPAERFQSPQDVADALQDYFGAPPTSAANKRIGESGRFRWWLVAAAMLIGVLGVFAYQNEHLFSWRVSRASDVYAPISELESYIAAMAASPHDPVFMNVYELGTDQVALGFKASSDGLLMDIDVSSSGGSRSRGNYANRMKEIAATLSVPVTEEAQIAQDGSVSGVNFAFRLTGQPSAIAKNAYQIVTEGLALNTDANGLFQCRNFPSHVVCSDDYSERRVSADEFVAEYERGERVFLGEIEQRFFLIPEERRYESPVTMNDEIWYADVRDLPIGFARQVRLQAADEWYRRRLGEASPRQGALNAKDLQPELKLESKTVTGGTGGLPKVHTWHFKGRNVSDWTIQLLLAENGKTKMIQEVDFEELPSEFTNQIRLQVKDPVGADHQRSLNAVLQVECPSGSRCNTTNENKGVSINIEAPFGAEREKVDLSQVAANQSELLFAQGYWKDDMNHGTSMELMTEATKDGTAVFLFVTLDWKPAGNPVNSSSAATATEQLP